MLVNRSGFSRAVYDRNGHLLRLTLSSDEKLRLWVPLDETPPAMIDATLMREDSYFRWHPGVNPISLIRAAWMTYVLGGRRVGGSTITMQLARQCFGIDSRSFGGKLEQIAVAIELERHYTKDEILEAYLNTVPYGGNVEGVGAASLVYFGKEPHLWVPEATRWQSSRRAPACAVRRPTRTRGAHTGAIRTAAEMGTDARGLARRGLPTTPLRSFPGPRISFPSRRPIW